MAEPALPVWLITLFEWSDTWWYSVIRVALAAAGVFLFLTGILVAFGQFFRGMLIVLLGAVTGPHMGLIIPMQWSVPECAGWAVALGRAWSSSQCDLFGGVSSAYYLSPESIEAHQRVAEIESHWLFVVLAWLLFLWGIWSLSTPARRRFVTWWTQRRKQ